MGHEGEISKKSFTANLTDPELIRRDLEQWRDLLNGAIAGDVRQALQNLINETEKRLAAIEGRGK